MSEKAETKTRKKTEHTRIVAQLCSSANEIFTSVVVYSRTTKIQQSNTLSKRYRLLCNRVLLRETMIIKRKKREKKRSTHTCMHNCAAREHNIHVGCCLFSHKINVHGNVKNQSDIVNRFDVANVYEVSINNNLICVR